jgi:hypothetical protein
MAPVLIVCVVEAGVACGAVVLGGAIVTRWAKTAAGSVERSLGREIERDPARRGGRPNIFCLLRPEAAIRKMARTTITRPTAAITCIDIPTIRPIAVLLAFQDWL